VAVVPSQAPLRPAVGCPALPLPYNSYNKTLLKGFAHPLTVTNIQVGVLSGTGPNKAALIDATPHSCMGGPS
jgi:hypothetical protein